MRFADLAEMLERQAGIWAERGIVFIRKSGDGSLSYRKLYEDSIALAAQLRDRGVGLGDELVIRIENMQAFVPAFWACVMGGIIPVPLAAGSGEEGLAKLQGVWSQLAKPKLLTDEAGSIREAVHNSSLSLASEDVIDWGEVTRQHECAISIVEPPFGAVSERGPKQRHYPSPDDIAFIQFSSGSTGDPKGVVLTHRNLMANIDAIVEGSRSKSDDRSLSWMPLTHDMGLIGLHLAPIYAGMAQFLMQPSQFMMDPAMWLAKSHEYRITSLASPNFGYKHVLSRLKQDDLRRWDLSAVRLIFNGAEPISAEWANRFVEALSASGLNPAAMFPVYGMAEATLAVTFPPVEEPLQAVTVRAKSLKLGDAAELAQDDEEDGVIAFVDVGYPVAGCGVRITDEQDQAAGELVVGHIQIRGSGVTKGYYNNEEATSRSFTADGWLRTGDIGFMRNGRLIITGRHKDIMFVRGLNVYPHDVERLAERLDGIGNGRAAVCGVKPPSSGEEEIALFVVHRGKLDRFAELAEGWKRQLNRELGLDVYAILPVRQIPRTTSGKIQRYLLAQRWQSGEWEPIVQELARLASERSQRIANSDPSSAGDIEENRTELVSDAAETPELNEGARNIAAMQAIWQEALGNGAAIRPDSHFLELGGNSLKAAQAAFAISSRWGIDVSIGDLYRYPTPKQLLAKLAELSEPDDAAAGEPIASLARCEGEETYSVVAFAERRMALLEQIDGIGSAYQIAITLDIAGELEPDAVRAALETLIERHETLRTAYHWAEGEVSAAVVQRRNWDEPWWKAVRSANGEAAAEEMEWLLRPIRLDAPPMLRALFSTDGSSRHQLALSVHHIASDGIGMQVLMREFAALLNGQQLPGGPAACYRDYAKWHNERLDSAAAESSRQYWARALQGPQPAIDWPGAAARQDRRTYRGSTVELKLPAAIASGLNRLGADCRAPMSAVLHALFGSLLYRYTGHEEHQIGMLLAGRDHPDTANIVGMFNNYVPVRLSVSRSRSFAELLDETSATVLDSLRHSGIPYETIVSLAQSPPEPGRNPLFDTMIVLHNQSGGMNAAFEAAGCRFVQRFIETGTAKLDLKLDVFPEPAGEWTCVWEYNEAFFTRTTAKRLSRLWAKLAEEVAKRPDAAIGELDLLDDEERRLLLAEFNGTAVDHGIPDATLHARFRRQAAETPDRVAAVFASETLAYRQLDERSDRLAERLRALGVRRGHAVGLMAERSPALLVGVLAILKAGGAYVPLPPDFPAERLRFMAEDSGIRAAIVQEAFLAAADLALHNVQHAVVSEAGIAHGEPLPWDLMALGEELSEESVTPDDLAYILFTSGSTGKPKGVMIRHGAVMNRIGWMQRAYPLEADDVIVQKTPYSFDVSVWELFWWMFAGASAAFPAPGEEKDPLQLLQSIRAHGATTMHFVPSMLAAFIEAVQLQQAEELQTSLRTLKLVFASGETLQPSHVKRFYALMERAGNTACRLINLYGPTEAAVDVTVYECEREAELPVVPIGRPIDNTSAYVVSASGLLQPIGVPGELCIGGVQVADGYVNRPELTAERFVADRYSGSEGARLYRTGDLARWTEEGVLEYIGRIDNQVKIRGNRIELGEIERVLLTFEQVSEAAVAVFKDETGSSSLCAYIVADRACSAGDLRRHCGERLPSYMLPDAFVQLERMPLTASGKADRRALPGPHAAAAMATGTSYAEPGTETEKALAALWQELLGRKPIGLDDDFFELGGHSLKGAALLSSVHRTFLCHISLRDLFDYPTVRGLAKRIDERRSEGEPAAYADIPKQPSRSLYPLSAGQNRLFVLQQLEPAGTSYHVSALLRITGPLDRIRLQEAFAALIRRHDMLRASFHWIEGKPMMRIEPAAQPEWEQIELAEGQSLLDPAALNAAVLPFALDRAPLLRLRLIAASDNLHALSLDMHHLIADGLSVAALAREFMMLYEGSAMPELPVAYTDYAAWQEQWLASEASEAQERYWLRTLAGTPPVLSMPADYRRPDRLEFAGDDVVVEIGEALADKLQALGSATGATMFMTLLAAFQALLHRYTGDEDIRIGTPVGGRPHAQLRDTVGMFVNTVVIRSAPKGNATFRELLAQTRAAALAALENDRYPFERLVDKLSVRRDNSRNPLFDTMFILQNTGIPSIRCGEVEFAPMERSAAASKFDLTLEVIESAANRALRCRFEYRTKLFRRERIERMAAHWLRLLEEAAARPDAAIGELDLLDEAERELVRHGFNRTAVELPLAAETLHEQFRRQAALTPERPAAVFESVTLTYRELAARSDKLAERLMSLGLRRGDAVGLMAQRSPAMMIAVLGILKAGCAYVPLPPDYPAERLRFMAEDSGLRAVCVQRQWLAAAGAALTDAVPIVAMEDEGAAASESSVQLTGTVDGRDERKETILTVPPVPPIVTADDLAYILFTSGSTGRPKGVMIRHGAVMNRIGWMQRAYPLAAGDVIVQKTPYSFDVSVWELFWWMLAGASAAFAAPGAEKEPDRLLQLIHEREATTVHFVPSMLAAFIESAQHQPAEALRCRLRTLKRVFASGEALQPSHVERFYALMESAGNSEARLINLYGPTEATVDVTVYECEPGAAPSTVPIGRPIDNTTAYVVSESGKLQPIGMPGELYIGGIQVAAGYANRPELTAERFVPDLFAAAGNEDAKLYRTGDLVRWTEEGVLAYIGRLDNQVKIRGFRIELDEIERALLAHESVSQAAAAVIRDEAGGSSLCAYVVADRAFTSGELRRHCSERLPAYMLPESFVQLAEMPLTASGKADRKALPKPQAGTAMETGSAYAEPRTETEQALASLWRELLALDKVGIRDPFFELGGNSLLLIRLHRALHDRYPQYESVSVADLFAFPTIEQLARHLDSVCSSARSQAVMPALLELPVGWQADLNVHGPAETFRMPLSQDMEEQLAALGTTVGLGAGEAGLGAFVLLLAQQLGRPAMELAIGGLDSRGQGRVRLLQVDLRQTKGYADLLAMLRRWQSETPVWAEPPKRHMLQEGRVLILFHAVTDVEPPAEWLGKSALAFVFNDGAFKQSGTDSGGTTARLAAQLRIDTSSVSKPKALQLLKGFPAALRKLMDAAAAESGLASSGAEASLR